jgi:hypothetical protein
MSLRSKSSALQAIRRRPRKKVRCTGQREDGSSYRVEADDSGLIWATRVRNWEPSPEARKGFLEFMAWLDEELE